MFCEKEAKQVVRHGDIRSVYSDDEEMFHSDDSVLDTAQNRVGVVKRGNDNYGYVDAMTNRLNETDLRLLRAAVNERPKVKAVGGGDVESVMLPSSYTNEHSQINQEFERKVKFSGDQARPQPRAVNGSSSNNVKMSQSYNMSDD